MLKAVVVRFLGRRSVDPWGGATVTNSTTSHELSQPEPSSIAAILDELKPMGDLSRFVITDMGPDEEDEFFTILEEA